MICQLSLAFGLLVKQGSSSPKSPGMEPLSPSTFSCPGLPVWFLVAFSLFSNPALHYPLGGKNSSTFFQCFDMISDPPAKAIYLFTMYFPPTNLDGYLACGGKLYKQASLGCLKLEGSGVPWIPSIPRAVIEFDICHLVGRIKIK
ncbi:UNVERIFIED_CONTAM: hypothetical protein K2H54_054225 [Gekko kuhli]